MHSRMFVAVLDALAHVRSGACTSVCRANVCMIKLFKPLAPFESDVHMYVSLVIVLRS